MVIHTILHIMQPALTIQKCCINIFNNPQRKVRPLHIKYHLGLFLLLPLRFGLFTPRGSTSPLTIVPMAHVVHCIQHIFLRRGTPQDPYRLHHYSGNLKMSGTPPQPTGGHTPMGTPFHLGLHHNSALTTVHSYHHICTQPTIPLTQVTILVQE